MRGDWDNYEEPHQGGEFLQWKFLAFCLGVLLFLILAGWIWWNFDKYYALAFIVGTAGLLSYWMGQRQATYIVRSALHDFVDAQHATGQTAQGMFKVMGQMINLKKTLATEDKKARQEQQLQMVEPEPWELAQSGSAGYINAVDHGTQSGDGPTYYS